MANVNRTADDSVESVVVEWAPFRVATGVPEATLLDASEALQRDFLAHQPGFLRRELLRGDDGQWVDLVYWANEASAKGVIEAVASSPVCQSYFQLMVGGDGIDPSAGVLHARRVRVYE